MLALSTLLAFAGNLTLGTGNRSLDQLFDNMTDWVGFILIAMIVTSVYWHIRQEESDE